MEPSGRSRRLASAAKTLGLLIDVVTSRLEVNEGAHGGIDHHSKQTSTGITLTFSNR